MIKSQAILTYSSLKESTGLLLAAFRIYQIIVPPTKSMTAPVAPR